ASPPQRRRSLQRDHRSSATRQLSTAHPGTTPTPPPAPLKRDSAPSACAGTAYQSGHDRKDTTPPFAPAGSRSHTAAYAPTASTCGTASPAGRKDAACWGYRTHTHRVSHIPHT